MLLRKIRTIVLIGSMFTCKDKWLNQLEKKCIILPKRKGLDFICIRFNYEIFTYELIVLLNPQNGLIKWKNYEILMVSIF